jgi:hypothetical protein
VLILFLFIIYALTFFVENFKAIDELARIISKKKLSYSKDGSNV